MYTNSNNQSPQNITDHLCNSVVDHHRSTTCKKNVKCDSDKQVAQRQRSLT